jgi:hypothetical protein
VLLGAICCFAAAALGGLFLALRILSNKQAPLAVAVLHGGAGATGLGALALFVLATDGARTETLALGILAANAGVGFFLFSRHLRRRPWPKPAVLLHGLAALIGFAILLAAYLGGE